VVIPSIAPAPVQSAIALFDATSGDLETANRPRVTVLSADGKKIYTKFYDNTVDKIWDMSWTVLDFASSQMGQQTGQSAIRSFNQSFAPGINQPRQTIVATNGLNYWIRFYTNGTWQAFSQSSTTGLNLPNAEVKMASFTMTAGDLSDAQNGLIRPKIMVVSADGTKVYSKYFDTNNSNQWDANWTTLNLSTSAIGTQLGVNAVRSFNQMTLFGQPSQQAISVDGRTRYERFWTAGAWGSWKSYPVTSLAITGTSPTLLPMP
jgi:hypothetical protein